MRHYAGSLREQGFRVDYRRAADTLSGLRDHVREHHADQIVTMATSEHLGREFQGQLYSRVGIQVQVLPNTQFLLGEYNPLPDPEPGTRYTQEVFYRAMRRHFGLLLESGGEPVGGQWNYDKQNRRRLPNRVQVPTPIQFAPDQVTRRVMQEVESLGQRTGTIRNFRYAVTHEQALKALDDFIHSRLGLFGSYQDAMRQSEGVLFHSLLSPYLNLGLLTPLQVAKKIERAYQDEIAPLNSVEGFIRQVIGWREYMYWQYWRVGPGYNKLNYWHAGRMLPSFFWDGQTELNCLKTVIQRILDTGYAHHIERLMILSNFCLLAGIHPGEVNKWFLGAFVDACEWVMLPNVYGMGLYADGGLTSTKPYMASANYINRMSDYCKSCVYDCDSRTGPQACPFNYLYWNFMIKKQEMLRQNPRMRRNLIGLRRFDSHEQAEIVLSAITFLKDLC